MLHISPDGIIHGVVHTCAGDQGEDGYDQVGDGGELADPGHGLGVDGGKYRTPEIAHNAASGQPLCGPEHDPHQGAPQGAEEYPQIVNVENNAEADAACKAV